MYIFKNSDMYTQTDRWSKWFVRVDDLVDEDRDNVFLVIVLRIRGSPQEVISTSLLERSREHWDQNVLQDLEGGGREGAVSIYKSLICKTNNLKHVYPFLQEIPSLISSPTYSGLYQRLWCSTLTSTAALESRHRANLLHGIRVWVPWLLVPGDTPGSETRPQTWRTLYVSHLLYSPVEITMLVSRYCTWDEYVDLSWIIYLTWTDGMVYT